jgi:hydroxymethylpyrimidine pyrophosphatase-like HAD family hydrolase
MDAPDLQPLAHWPRTTRAGIKGVFTDIDDTLTTHGAITPDALAALAALRGAGLQVLAITGRPVGWAEPKAREWPVDAVVAENGAVALVPPGPLQQDFSRQIGLQPAPVLDSPLQKRYQLDAGTRAREYTRLQQVAQRVLREVPGARLARDSGGRETDIAFDHAEFEQLAPATIDAIEAVMRAEGLRTTRSSIHTHGAVSACDKWTGAVWAVRELLGRDLTSELDQWVAVGDSGNDEPMFRHFRHSVGVANIGSVLPRLAHRPRWLTQAERGAGFAELATALLAARH